MKTIIPFLILSIPIVILSWRTLFNFQSHGFYRFFSWECISWLLVNNIWFWFKNPLSILQLISWICLIYSGYLILVGVILMKKKGKPDTARKDEKLYAFERTTTLIQTGLYNYIRHPLYGSLFFLTLGIFFKNITISLAIVALVSCICLILTAVFEEKEDIAFFGQEYSEYMKRTTRFVPFLF